MSAAANALVYLRLTSARNLIVARLTRLKRPKYLFGGIVGLAYLYLVFVRPAAHRSTIGALASSDPDTRAALIWIAALLLLVGFALCWVLPRERASLSFSEAEIAFLFPAPIQRTTLVHYRLIGTHFSVLVSAAVFYVMSMRWKLQSAGALIGLLGWWIVWMTMQLHILGSAFTLTRLADAGASRGRWQTLVSATLGLTLAIVVALAWRDWHVPQPNDLAGGLAVTHYIGRVLAGSRMSWMLRPTWLLARILFVSDWRSFAAALGPALLIYAAHYLWVLRAQTTFEEAALARAEKRAARLAAMRKGRSPLRATITPRRPRFALRGTGPAPVAFLWKNLLSTPNYVRLRTPVVFAAIAVAVTVWLSRSGRGDARLAIGFVAAIAGGPNVFLLGPLLARQDLRSDMPNVDILKTYPLRGWQIVLGEILTPVTVVCTVFWMLLLTVALTVHDPDLEQFGMLARVSGGIALGLLAVPVVGIEVLVLNAVALLFPAWSTSPANQTERGIEMMGQRLLLFAGLLAVIVAALTPAAVLGGATFWMARWLVSIQFAIGAALTATLTVLIGEVATGVWFVGRRFDRFDLSTELQPHLK